MSNKFGCLYRGNDDEQVAVEKTKKTILYLTLLAFYFFVIIASVD